MSGDGRTADGRRPLINHVAITVDAAVLDQDGRAALLDFYGAVFGWVEGDNSTERGNPLIVYTGVMRQFLYLLPSSEEYLRAPRLDHFGLEIASLEELVSILDRAKAYRQRDDRVDIIDLDEMMTNAYIGFLIPLMIELQHIAERPAG
jgi:hypothetical protein